MAKVTQNPFIKVRFFEPRPDGRTEFYFGSRKAIFEVFTKEDIGCSPSSIYNLSTWDGNRKVTSKCIIEKEYITRAAQQKSVVKGGF